MKTHIFTTQEQEQSLVCEKTKRMPRLTNEERSELSECEKTIQLGQKGTAEVAKALHWVWERRLYREGYRTFRIYCRQRWHREKSYGHDLLRFASIQKQLSAYADIIRLPSCEAHTRPLGCVPEGADRAAIWRRALTMTSHVTGRTVVQAREEYWKENPERIPIARRKSSVKFAPSIVHIELTLELSTLQSLKKIAKDAGATVDKVITGLLETNMTKFLAAHKSSSAPSAQGKPWTTDDLFGTRL